MGCEEGGVIFLPWILSRPSMRRGCNYVGTCLDPGVALAVPRALLYLIDVGAQGTQDGVRVLSVSLCPYVWLQLIHTGRQDGICVVV